MKKLVTIISALHFLPKDKRIFLASSDVSKRGMAFLLFPLVVGGWIENAKEE